MSTPWVGANHGVLFRYTLPNLFRFPNRELRSERPKRTNCVHSIRIGRQSETAESCNSREGHTGRRVVFGEFAPGPRTCTRLEVADCAASTVATQIGKGSTRDLDVVQILGPAGPVAGPSPCVSLLGREEPGLPRL